LRALPGVVFLFFFPFSFFRGRVFTPLTFFLGGGGGGGGAGGGGGGGGRPSPLVFSLAFLSLSVQILGFCFNLDELFTFHSIIFCHFT